GFCGVADRTGRGTQPRDAAVKAVRVHDRGARRLRARRTRGRIAGAGHLRGDPAVRALVGGTVPLANHGTLAGGNPPAGAAENGRQRLSSAVGRSSSRSVFLPQANDLSTAAFEANRRGKTDKASSNCKTCNIYSSWPPKF